MNKAPPAELELTYYSDLLCVFAFVSEVKISALKATHGSVLKVVRRACDSFGNTATKIGEGWKDKGGWEGYANHVAEVASRFDHVTLHPDVWRKVRPASSHSPHLLLKALAIVGTPHDLQERAAWSLREAFFSRAADIGGWDVQREVLTAVGVPIGPLDGAIRDGSAFAALAADYEAARDQKIEGSPSFILPDDRQKLYGDVGYRILDANVRERLRVAEDSEPPWC